MCIRDRLRFEHTRVAETLAQAVQSEEDALSSLHESDARYTAVTEHLARLTQQLEAAQGEVEAAETERQALAVRLEEYAAVVAEADRQAEEAARVAEQGTAPDGQGLEDRPAAGGTKRLDPAERDAAEEAAAAARHAETEARLSVRTAESVLSLIHI